MTGGSFTKLVALLLVVSLVIVGCRVLKFQIPGQVPFSEMEYERPEAAAIEEQAAACVELAKDADDVGELMDEVYVFYELYSGFYTNYMLAYIHYAIDTSDAYWSAEQEHCIQQGDRVDAAFDDLMYALADCPLRQELEAEMYFGEGYFDDYDGESIWTDAYKELIAQETDLIGEYYDICEEAEDPYQEYDALSQVYVELVRVRQQMAREAGYDSYPEYAYDYTFRRDYGPEQARDYLEDIRKELVPLYEDLDSDVWQEGQKSCTTARMYAYVEETAKAMGGGIQEAFQTMERLGLYHIEPGEHKMEVSFETFLADYFEPFVFVCPDGTRMDQLAFAHEFGHFCNDYQSGGSSSGIDVAEIFSQGMEYLSLSYGDAPQELAELKMADSLCVFVEQSAYAAFELEVYELEGKELTEENVEEIFRQVGQDYGFDGWGFDPQMYVAIPHFFTDPGYVISYVVSNDAALQIYQLEQEEEGQGLACYQESLDTEMPTLLAFLEEAGLESPFAPGRVKDIRDTLEEVLS